MERNRTLAWLLTASVGLTLVACGLQAPDNAAEQARTASSLEQALNGPAPELTAVSPSIGPTKGLMNVTLTGKNFRPGVRVSFNGVPSASVTVLSSTQLTAYLPASPGAFGRVPIELTLPDGKSVTRGDLFYYYADAISWRLAYHYADSVAIRSFVLRDMNGDGVLDVVATDNVHANVVVLVGASDGTLAEPKLTPVIDGPDSLVVADFNGDGKLDVVVEGERSTDFNVLLGRGDGTFAISRITNVVANAHGLAAADVNEN